MTGVPMMELKNDTLTLRPFELRDAVAHLSGEDAEQIRWVSGGKSTVESVEDWIRKKPGVLEVRWSCI